MQLDLRHGPFTAALAPHSGCRTLFFRMNRDSGETVDLMRPFTGTGTRPNDAANFPLVPYSNRIGDGRFVFRGETIQLPQNAPGESHAIHGVGWDVDWDVIGHTDREAACRYRHPGDSRWPWAFTTDHSIRLDDRGMTVVLTLTNDAPGPMPGGLALHPYFPRTADTCLIAAADGFIERDAAGLPSRLLRQHPVLAALGKGESVPVGVDTGLEGWTGQAEIRWPDRRIALGIEAPGISRAVLYTPEGRSYFCFEPISHTTNAVNRLPDGMSGDGGVRILHPGETMSLEMRVLPKEL